MSTLLIRHAECAASFDDARRELRGASVLVSDQLIEAIGPAAELPATLGPSRAVWLSAAEWSAHCRSPATGGVGQGGMPLKSHGHQR